MNSLLRPIDAILPRSARNFGGKVRNLAVLARAGFPVPMAYALSCEAAELAFQASLPPELQPSTLFKASVCPDEALSEARERALALTLEPALCQALSAAFAEMRKAGVESLAVRSSSTAEDQQAASAAGLHTTRLNVLDDEQLFAAVRECWASVFSPSVYAYLHALGAESAGSLGLVIQALVPADVAGVLFTANPLTSNATEMVINAAYGLGHLVVDGRVSPDTYYIDKASGFLRDRVVGEKRWRGTPAAQGGVEDRPVTELLASRQALDEHALARLTDLGRRIERHFGDARDVEWALLGDALYVLQARPIVQRATAPVRRRRPRQERSLTADPGVVWSNVNVGEALPGVATPLTWSVLAGFSDLGFRRAFAALGCTVPKRANLVGNFRGRIYLNLSELAQIAAQVPGLRPAAVLPLGGGSEIERLERGALRASPIAFLSRLPLTAARFAHENLGLRGRIERFEPGFRAECQRVRSLDLRILSSPALDETLSDAEQLLNEAGGLLLTAYGGLLAALVPLSATLRAFRGAGAAKLQRDLLSSLEDVESAHPARELLHIAELVVAEPGVRDAIMSGSRQLRAEHLLAGQAREAIVAFQKRFGHRGIREAELSEPRWREDPTLIFDTIRLHVRALPDQMPSAIERGKAVRAEGERALRELGLPSRAAVLALLRVVRNAMRQREHLRDHVVQVLDLLRLLSVDASRRMLIREPEVGPDAAFFLTLPELHAFLRGELRTVRPLVQMRRAGYERDRTLPDPPDTFVDYPPPAVALSSSRDVLEGLPASSGQVQGRARVLTSTREISGLEPGEILIVPAADVGWSPLFLAAGGLATDLGGPLSHACVVAREYGIPAVVNLREATRTVKTGDKVLLDGDAGRLQVLHD
ncbi:MAG: PEP/pyruvate-binding domain-containing protein [Polyangiales bacterium]